MMMTQPRHPALHLEEVVPQLRLTLGSQVLLQAGAAVRHSVDLQRIWTVLVECVCFNFLVNVSDSSVPKRIIAGKGELREMSKL